MNASQLEFPRKRLAASVRQSGTGLRALSCASGSCGGWVKTAWGTKNRQCPNKSHSTSRFV